MNYDKSLRNRLDHHFENPEIITLEDILSYTFKRVNNYEKGGFYMIESYQNIYIGRSKDFMYRLRQHTYKSTVKTKVDIELNKSIGEYKFYLLANYKAFSIDFFNRKLETIIEQTFIAIALNKGKNILNDKIHGHLQVI